MGECLLHADHIIAVSYTHLFDQLIHAGGHSDSLVVALVREGRNGDILSRFQIQTMELFQPPEKVALGQGAHIFSLPVEHRNGRVAVILRCV